MKHLLITSILATMATIGHAELTAGAAHEALPLPQSVTSDTLGPHSQAPVIKPLQDLEYSSLPLFAFGLLAKGQKEDFHAARDKFVPNYKCRVDEVLQFTPAAVAFALNLCGYEGRSSFKRLFVSSCLSAATTTVCASGMKYMVSETRPDGSSDDSFPSGHTARAFCAATVLHKEYGLTRSPWFSVGAYSVATLTGVMRVLNNRHWISDVLVGAGIGIISTDIGYMLADLWFKDKGLNYDMRDGSDNLTLHPSFLRLSMGASYLSDLQLPSDALLPATLGHTLRVGTATTVGAEAAYFINPYIGIGGRVRVLTAPIYAEGMNSLALTDGKAAAGTCRTSDVMALTDWSVGPYVSYPICHRFAVGTKALYGRRYLGDILLQADYIQPDLDEFRSDALSVTASPSDMFSTGLSATYAIGHGTALTAYWDYDLCRSAYSASYHSCLSQTSLPLSFTQRTHSHTFGASMTVMF